MERTRERYRSVNPGQQMDGDRQTFEREKQGLRLREGHKVTEAQRHRQASWHWTP